MPLPTAGSPAPPFELVSDKGRAMRLADLKGRAVVLFFYPKDDTPGCTVEACAFRDDYQAYDQAGAVIIGVSPDSVTSHVKFKEKFHLPFPLLADVGHKVADAYGVWGEKHSYGKTTMGVRRTTFLIGKDGRILRVFENVKPNGHSKEILEALKG